MWTTDVTTDPTTQIIALRANDSTSPDNSMAATNGMMAKIAVQGTPKESYRK